MKKIRTKLVGFLLMVLLCNTAAQLGCPTSWVRSDGNCFKVVFWGRDTRYNAEEADDHCKSLGGRIASIHSDEDFNALRGSWPNGCCTYYFGLKRDESGHWGYTDTTSYDYKNWWSDQENSTNGDCVGMSSSWVTVRCSTGLNGVICRKPIVDTKAPEAYCPNTTETVEVGSTSGLSVHFAEPIIYDESSPVRVTSSSASPGNLFYPGETRVVYTFEDPSHNVGSCVFYVIITEVDTTPPTVSCSDVTSKMPLESSGTRVYFTEPIAFDNSGHVEIFAQSSQPGDFFSEGVTTVTYVYMDSSGNTAHCSFIITVYKVDMTPPVVTCNNFTLMVPLDSIGSNVLYTEPKASDNSGHVVMTSRSNQPGDFFAIGATEVSYTFHDVSENNASCAFYVIVERENGEGDISKELEKILKIVEEKSLSLEIVNQTLGELSDLTSNSAQLTENDVDDIANILLVMSHFNTSSSQVSSFLVKVVDNLITTTLAREDDGEIISTRASTNAILQSLERQLDNIQRSGKNFSSSGQNIAVEVVQVESFDMPILFGSFPQAKENMNETLEASVVTDLSNDRKKALTSIQLDPKALLEAFPQGQKTLPLAFVVHRSGILFQSPEKEKTRLQLNSFVIAASTTVDIKNLPAESSVVTQFRKKRNFDQGVTQCMFWDHSLKGSLGGWSEEGCYLAGEDNSEISCFCNHLTSFAILVNPYGDVKHGLVSTLSIIGCVISIVSLLLTVVSFLAIRSTRSKVPQKIIINLSFALLGLYLFFLIGMERTNLQVGCVIFGALIHFFLLASIAWMSVEATNMYLMFVKVLNANVRHFLWKASLFAWVAPLIVVTTSVVSSPKSYSTGDTCFPHYSSHIFYVAVFGLVVLLLIYNVFMFILVTWKLTWGRKRISASTESQKETIRRLRNAFAISVLLGLTWTIGLLPVRDHILHLIISIFFCLFNSLQGCLIFILFCLRHKEVQDAWKKWLHIPSHEKQTSTKSSVVSNQTNARKLQYEKGSDRLETVPSEDTSGSTDRSKCITETDNL